MKELSEPGEFERRLIDDARKVVGHVNGNDITGLDHAWMKLKSMMDRPEAVKLVLQYYREALASEQGSREAMVKDLLAYKAHWGPIFALKRKLNQPLPKLYPDPDDIVILSPTEFRFLGPVTEGEASDWETYRRGRETFFMVAREIIEGAGHFYSVEDGFARWSKLRRQYYRVNRHLPAIFKRKCPAKFPPFEPTKEPPPWYEEEDEC